MNYRLHLAHLYSSHMNVYGDRGNVIALKQRCAWRGIELSVIPIEPGMAVDWSDFDLAFFGGGQDSGQALIARDLLERQGAGLRAAIEDGLVLLAICGGYQLLGHYFLTHTGERLPGLGALDVYTIGGKRRLIGNIVVEARLGEGAPVRLVGFENHSGRTYTEQGCNPWAGCWPVTATMAKTVWVERCTATPSAATCTGPCCRRTPSSPTI